MDTAHNIRGAELKVIPGMGHDFPPALQPEIATLIERHIARASGTAQTAPAAAGVSSPHLLEQVHVLP